MDKDFNTLALESKAAWDAGDFNGAYHLMMAARCAADAEGKLGPGSTLEQAEDGSLFIRTVPT